MSIKKQIEAEAIKAVAKRAWVKRFKPNCATHKYAKELFEAGAAFRDRWWAERWMRQVDHYVMNTVHSQEKMKLSQEMTAAAEEVLG